MQRGRQRSNWRVLLASVSRGVEDSSAERRATRCKPTLARGAKRMGEGFEVQFLLEDEHHTSLSPVDGEYRSGVRILPPTIIRCIPVQPVPSRSHPPHDFGVASITTTLGKVSRGYSRGQYAKLQPPTVTAFSGRHLRRRRFFHTNHPHTLHETPTTAI
jgi:hypothetical protein